MGDYEDGSNLQLESGEDLQESSPTNTGTTTHSLCYNFKYPTPVENFTVNTVNDELDAEYNYCLQILNDTNQNINIIDNKLNQYFRLSTSLLFHNNCIKIKNQTNLYSVKFILTIGDNSDNQNSYKNPIGDSKIISKLGIIKLDHFETIGNLQQQINSNNNDNHIDSATDECCCIKINYDLPKSNDQIQLEATEYINRFQYKSKTPGFHTENVQKTYLYMIKLLINNILDIPNRSLVSIQNVLVVLSFKNVERFDSSFNKSVNFVQSFENTMTLKQTIHKDTIYVMDNVNGEEYLKNNYSFDINIDHDYQIDISNPYETSSNIIRICSWLLKSYFDKYTNCIISLDHICLLIEDESSSYNIRKQTNTSGMIKHYTDSQLNYVPSMVKMDKKIEYTLKLINNNQIDCLMDPNCYNDIFPMVIGLLYAKLKFCFNALSIRKIQLFIYISYQPDIYIFLPKFEILRVSSLTGYQLTSYKNDFFPFENITQICENLFDVSLNINIPASVKSEILIESKSITTTEIPLRYEISNDVLRKTLSNELITEGLNVISLNLTFQREDGTDIIKSYRKTIDIIKTISSITMSSSVSITEGGAMSSAVYLVLNKAVTSGTLIVQMTTSSNISFSNSPVHIASGSTYSFTFRITANTGAVAGNHHINCVLTTSGTTTPAFTTPIVIQNAFTVIAAPLNLP